MLLNSYFKISIRSLVKNRWYSLINIVGLSLGIAVCLLTFNFVQLETGYDTTHPDIDRLYRVNQTNIWDPAGGVFGSVGPAVAPALKADFPEIEEVTRINTPGGFTVRYTEPNGHVLAFNEDQVLAADSNFFHFFDFKLKEGNTQALYGKNKVVLSDKAARRLFGDEPALGKIIQIGDDKASIEVTGVTAEQAENIHFHFDYLLSIYTNPNVKQFEWSWIWTQTVTYVKLRPDADPQMLGAKLLTFADRHAPATFQKLNMDYDAFVKEKGGWFLYLQPVRDIYLYSDRIGNRIGPVGDIKYVYILSAVAFFVLLTAVVNFINLSTARGATRAKEVGVKKTLGMLRSSLIAQFQVEHITITLFSLILGLGILEMLRAMIQPLTGIEIPSGWGSPIFWVVMIAFPIVIGFLAGVYPALYLTAFNPVQVLKGRVSKGFKSSGLRNGLVVLQFTISIALMAATLIVYQQLQFFQSRSVGFDRENLLIIDNAEKLGPQLEAFRNEISLYQGVKNASLSMDFRGGFEDIFAKEGDDARISLAQFKVDEHFISTTGLSMASGRAFELDRPSDRQAVMINETAARALGWTNEEALGKKIRYLGDDIDAVEIIGVVKDFHFRSLRQNIYPTVFYHLQSKMWENGRIVSIRYEGGAPYELLQRLESRWNQLTSEATPFSYAFYQEELKAQYKQEEHLGALFSLFTGLSMVIAIIGLIGLVAYSAEVMKKEIGVRKVFGASAAALVMMMNKSYMKLMAVSLLLATPITWWALQQWLDTFAYRVTISPLTFVAAGLLEALLALTCVAYLSLRAASTNPSAVLREE